MKLPTTTASTLAGFINATLTLLMWIASPLHPVFTVKGLGRDLYAAVIHLIQGRYPTLACEVNLRPPNLISETFHAQLGFVEVGQQDTEGGAKRVVMLTQDIQA